MSVAWVAAVLLWSDAGEHAPPAAPDPRPSAAVHGDLREATYAALRASRARGAEPRQFVPQLAAVYEQLRADEELRAAERAQLRRMVAKRLAEVGLDLLRDLKKAEADAATSSRAAARSSAPSTYRITDEALQAGSAGGGPDIAGARELVELIRTTIAPETWDVNGGRGTIVYYSPLKVLVIRQTSEVHELINALQNQLRK